MSSSSVVDQICQFFGGPYQAAFHYYGTPTVAGLGVVRRALPKNRDQSEFFHGMPDGTDTGAVMHVRIDDGGEIRVAMAGATSGYKKVHHGVELHVQVLSRGRAAEDIEDFTRTLLDAIRDRIHSDRTCGSGGIEAGKFEVGEDYEGPGSPIIAWQMSDVETSVEQSKQTLLITMSASEYIEA